MKTPIIILTALLCAITNCAFSQIPNPGFETWTSGNPDGWFVSNIPGAYTTTTQTSDAHTGTSAAHGEVVSFFSTPQAPIFQSGTDARGFPITQAPSAVGLFYKFTPQGGDRFAVNVAIHSNGNPIGAGAVALPAAISSYTALNVPINYTSTDIPDTAIIQISIIGPNGADFHLGSAMWVDDLSLSGATNLPKPTHETTPINLFPNPAHDHLQIHFPTTQPGEMYILDATGRTLKTTPFDPDGKATHLQIPVTDLPSGIYNYLIKTNNSQTKGKFSVCH
jgi:hypothetical protein